MRGPKPEATWRQRALAATPGGWRCAIAVWMGPVANSYVSRQHVMFCTAKTICCFRKKIFLLLLIVVEKIREYYCIFPLFLLKITLPATETTAGFTGITK